MRGLEDERKGALELLEHGLDQRGECDALVGFGVVNVFQEDCNRLSVGVGLEFVASLLQYQPEFIRVGDDAIVHDGEVAVGVGSDGMAVPFRRGSVCSPSRMRDADLGDEGLGNIDRGRGDLLAQPNDFADLLVEEDFAGLVAIYTETSGVIPAVFLTREAIAKNLEDFFATLIMERVVNTRRDMLIS